MVRMIKFQTSSFRIGPLEGSILYRLLLVAFAILIAIFYLGPFGFVSLALLPIFLLRIQHDYLDEFIVKKIKGITVSYLDAPITEKNASYEIAGTNYGLSEQQDRNIIYVWASIIESFAEDMMIIRDPYRVPLQRFEKGVEEYDSLFSGLVFYADAYFITISESMVEDFEKTLANYGVPFKRLREDEVETLNELI